VYRSKRPRSEIHRFEESEYERRGDVRARCEVGRDVACRGLVKRANGDIGVEEDIGDATRRSTSRYRVESGRKRDKELYEVGHARNELR
jgi:hypothetical protein